VKTFLSEKNLFSRPVQRSRFVNGFVNGLTGLTCGVVVFYGGCAFWETPF